MSYFMSNEIIKKNAESWTQNLTLDVRRRLDIPIIELLCNYTRLTPIKRIIGRYHTILEHTNR